MKKQQIAQIIQALKNDAGISSIFGDRVAFTKFHTDQEGVSLLIYTFGEKPKGCLNSELVQIQIIDAKTPSPSLEMKGYMDAVEFFLNSYLKVLDGFETIAIYPTSDESLLMNNKERYVYSKRFIFMY